MEHTLPVAQLLLWDESACHLKEFVCKITCMERASSGLSSTGFIKGSHHVIKLRICCFSLQYLSPLHSTKNQIPIFLWRIYPSAFLSRIFQVGFTSHLYFQSESLIGLSEPSSPRDCLKDEHMTRSEPIRYRKHFWGRGGISRGEQPLLSQPLYSEAWGNGISIATEILLPLERGRSC